MNTVRSQLSLSVGVKYERTILKVRPTFRSVAILAQNPTNICARQMVERQALVSTVSAGEIELLTYDVILLIARGAFARKEEDVDVFGLLLESSLKPALIGVKEFLGHDSQVHGGTMGDPITQPEYVRLLTEDLWHRVVDNSKFFFCPPWSKVEIGARAVTDYVWRAGVDRDI